MEASSLCGTFFFVPKQLLEGEFRVRDHLEAEQFEIWETDQQNFEKKQHQVHAHNLQNKIKLSYSDGVLWFLK